MQKAVEAAKKIYSAPEDNHFELLKDIDLYAIFKPIYKLNLKIKEANALCCYLIYAYDPDSERLDLRKDRMENKVDIMRSLDMDTDVEILADVINNECKEFNDAVASYLSKLTDWRWPTIHSLIDYHSSMIRFVSQKTEQELTWDKMDKDGAVKKLSKDIDMDVIAKINSQKSEIQMKAISARREADKMLDEIRKEYVATDHATQSDFTFQFTETAKSKNDIYSWRQYINGAKKP